MRNERILMRVGGVGCASIGIMLLIGFALQYQSEVSFKANAISATGTIIRTKEENTGGSLYAPHPRGSGYYEVTVTPLYISTVEFQTQQNKSIEFITTGACLSQQECKNKTILVDYIPSAPKQAKIHSDNSDTRLAARFGFHSLLSLLFISIGFWLLSSKSRKHRVTNN